MESDFRETLYTIDKRGKRRWVYPKEILGFFRTRRRVVAAFLVLFYLCLPWISINGNQAVHLDIFHRRFILFGQTFWATDTKYLFLVLVSLALSLFFFTALFGRIWCGWACPQTIFMEFVFRPLERLIEGNSAARLKLDQSPWTTRKLWIKGLKYLCFTVVAWFLASTFLAYFIGREPLLAMMTHSPFENWSTFCLSMIMIFVLLFEFAYFREQFCTVVCPYARFQSVPLDSASLLVGYDAGRGEPRGKASEPGHGDCIDCGLCVRVCPTGIDIRNGLQLECIQCTACIDACDSVMEKIGKPKGLIRYATELGLSGAPVRLLRPRTFVYGGVLLIVLATLIYSIDSRSLSAARIFHAHTGELFTEQEPGLLMNQIAVHIENKSGTQRNYSIELVDESAVELVVPMNPFPVAPGTFQSVPIFAKFPASLLKSGKHSIKFRVSDGEDFFEYLQIDLLGPG